MEANALHALANRRHLSLTVGDFDPIKSRAFGAKTLARPLR
jgi:hypothetical protein